MTVRAWIISMCAAFFIGFAALLGSSFLFSEKLFNNVTLPQISELLRERYEDSLKFVVDVEAQNIAKMLQGVTERDKMLVIVEQAMDHQRFFPNDEGYFFTYTTTGVRINVPVNKSQNGQNFLELRDSVGQPFVRSMIEKAKSGGGFVEYLFDKPGAGIQPKLSYARLIPGTDIMIGTGVYIDRMALEKKRILNMVNDGNWLYDLYQVGFGLAIFVVMLALAWYVARVICNPLRAITVAVTQVAEGNLDAKAKLSDNRPKEIDTLLYALRTMIKSLRERIEEAARKHQEAAEAMESARLAQHDAEVSATQAENKQKAILVAAEELEQIADVLFSTATQLSTQIEQSDRGAAESAQYLAESATAMNEMNATVREVAQNAAMASSVSQETRAKAQSGASIVKQSEQSIEQVRIISIDLKKDITQLSEHAQSITQIMNVISDIADQTNLLALNAAIEAARAGEAGRGFAVVADEVRKLAEKTMNSTHDVSNAILSIQTSTAKSVSAVDNAVQQIEQVTEFSNNSGKALQEIVATVDASADQVNAIATASEEQSAASEQINRSIKQASELSGQTAAAMASATHAVSNLVVQARKLSSLIGSMRSGK